MDTVMVSITNNQHTYVTVMSVLFENQEHDGHVHGRNVDTDTTVT